MKLWVKLGSLLYSLLLFGLFFNGLHELGHWQAAQWVGVPGGTITLTWTGGRYLYPLGFTPTVPQDLWVSLGGGFAVALVFGVGWLIRHASLRFSPWDLDDTFALFAWGWAQFLYSFTEVVNWQFWGGGITMMAGFLVAIALYGQRIMRWLEEE